jgi:CRP/FNR family transcriptional regulator, dissimilatory nitrate respiration regulator
MPPQEITNKELKSHPLMSGLSEDKLEKIRKTLKLVKLEAGECLFAQGDHADRFYQLRSGQIKLYRVSMEGNERVIEVIMPGQTFAEAILFMEERNYPVNSQALSNAELIAFDSDTFIKLLDASPETCFHLLADMSKRLHMRLNEIENLTLQNATFRLIHYLLQQISDDVEGNEAEFSLEVSKNIIASRLSIQPETFSRILKSLTKRELISVSGKTIHLLDIDGLRNFEA